MRAADAVLFTGSPPLMEHFIAPLNILLKKHLIYRITDFHPECLIAEKGRQGLLLAVQALSMTAIDLLSRPETVAAARAEFLQATARVAP